MTRKSSESDDSPTIFSLDRTRLNGTNIVDAPISDAASNIGSYREIAIAIESEAGDSLTSIDQSGFSRKERNLHCDVPATYTSALKTNTYCRRSGRQTRCGWRDRSDPDVAIKAYGVIKAIGAIHVTR